MKTKLYIALIIVFLSGLAIGFVVGQQANHWQIQRLLRQGPKPLEQMLTDRLAQKLALTPGQVAEVRNKVTLMIEEMDLARRTEGEAIQARMRRLLEDIRPLLNPAQQTPLDDLRPDDLRPDPPPWMKHGQPLPPWAPHPPKP